MARKRQATAASPSKRSTPALDVYQSKRDFNLTPEPAGVLAASGDVLAFVIQKHAARSLHYDFRLELDGVMLSWAIPKGPSYDPKVKRLAVRTEDHPLSYNQFEGTIPQGQYGAGEVIIWDRGHWQSEGDAARGLARGKLAFRLDGVKMHGRWELVRIKASANERQAPWLLFKKHDEFARAEADYDVVTALPDSVAGTARKTARARRPTSHQATAGLGVGAVKAAQPATMRPQLATLALDVPAVGHWSYEIKFDGYRIMARIKGGKVTLITRGGHDWSNKLPHLVQQLATLDVRNAWLDGEVVVMENGIPDFNKLQNAFDASRTDAIEYFLFDVPYLDGHDLRAVPLSERRARLQALLSRTSMSHVHFSANVDGDYATVLKSACALHLEGIIAKRSDSPYVSRRSGDWLKLKCGQRQEFVIVGYTDRKGDAASKAIGSLLLAFHDDDDHLVAAGSVGTGWDSATATALKTRLAKLEVRQSALSETATVKRKRWTRRPAAVVHWVKPRLVAEVSFSGWTPDQQVRHASFEGLRADKAAQAVTRESPRRITAGKKREKDRSPLTTHLKVTHPERIIDRESGATKLDLIRYYDSVAERMLPHLAARPCSFLRAPSGIESQLFFQKHQGKSAIKGVAELDAALWPKHKPLLAVASADGITAAAQANVIEFHTWNATIDKLDKPNRIVFDLDPGDGVPWQAMREGAALVRSLLAEFGLECWLKTSGGKGLHVVVPIARRAHFDTVNEFSSALVHHLAKVIPARFVAKSGPRNRVGRIFVDYLRNSHGATTVAAFSARARPGLGVSMPIAWDDLAKVERGDQWTIGNAREHLSFQRVDPWQGYWKSRQPLGKALKHFGIASR